MIFQMSKSEIERMRADIAQMIESNSVINWKKYRFEESVIDPSINLVCEACNLQLHGDWTNVFEVIVLCMEHETECPESAARGRGVRGT